MRGFSARGGWPGGGWRSSWVRRSALTREVELLVREMDEHGAATASCSGSTWPGKTFQATSIAVGEAAANVPAANVISLTNNCSRPGVDAIGQAVDLIKLSGVMTWWSAGGAEAPLTAVVCSAMKARRGWHEQIAAQPLEASRPFDRERDERRARRGGGGRGPGSRLVWPRSEARGPTWRFAGFHSLSRLPARPAQFGLGGHHAGARSPTPGCSVRDIDFISAWGCGRSVARPL